MRVTYVHGFAYAIQYHKKEEEKKNEQIALPYTQDASGPLADRQ